MATLTKSTGTVTLSGAAEKVALPAAYGWVWVKNMSEGDIFAGLSENISAGADGVLTISAGDAGRIQMDGSCEFYLLGSGNALVVAQNYADCPFKAGVKGGGSDVDGKSSYSVKNAVDYPLLGLNLFGKSTQDGVPTPENPVEIVSVESPTITVCGKNMYVGSQDWSGEWKNDAFFENVTETYLGLSVKRVKEYWTGLKKSLYVEKGKTYTFSCYAKSDDNIPCKIFILAPGEQINGTALPISYTESFNVGTEWTRYQLSYNCEKSGYIKPRIEKTAQDGNYLYVCGYQLEESKTMTDYAPYNGAIANITSALPLCGIPVAEGGNYTDKDGQQWVCDELIYNADGSGKVVKRTAKIVFNNNYAVNYAYDVSKAIIYNVDTNRINGKVLCNVADYAIAKWDADVTGNCFWGGENLRDIFVRVPVGLTNEEINNMGIKVIYQLAEPQEIPLTAAEMSALRTLQTFNGITNISNDSGADMDVSYCTSKMLSEYVMPITTGLQAQIDELKAAVLSLGGNV